MKAGSWEGVRRGQGHQSLRVTLRDLSFTLPGVLGETFFFWSGNDIISLIDFLGQLLWVWEEQILLEEGDREREGEREYLGTQNSCVIVSLKAYIFNRAPKSDKGLPT